MDDKKMIQERHKKSYKNSKTTKKKGHKIDDKKEVRKKRQKTKKAIKR